MYQRFIHTDKFSFTTRFVIQDDIKRHTGPFKYTKKDCSNLSTRETFSLSPLCSDSDSRLFNDWQSDEVYQQIYHTHLKLVEPELREAD